MSRRESEQPFERDGTDSVSCELGLLCGDRRCSSISLRERPEALQSRRARGRESSLPSEIAGDQRVQHAVHLVRAMSATELTQGNSHGQRETNDRRDKGRRRYATEARPPILTC